MTQNIHVGNLMNRFHLLCWISSQWRVIETPFINRCTKSGRHQVRTNWTWMVVIRVKQIDFRMLINNFAPNHPNRDNRYIQGVGYITGAVFNLHSHFVKRICICSFIETIFIAPCFVQ